ncbi:hypothetical protein AB0J74_22145 [Asanoa sp. NPDC049573]|uniref:hypothetical protein n=1 Tax=Asanoa sp. NPDC049573 TaxID=3155396 RepID=UPI00344292FC
MGAAVAVLAVAVGAAWLVRDGAARGRPDRADGVGDWRVVHDAFAVDDDWMGGPQLLVADPDGCYVGFGRDGLSTGYWAGEGDCLRSTVVTPQRFTGGDGIGGEDRNSVLSAVPAHGGGYLAITRHTFHGDAYAYETAIVRGDGAPGGWRTVAQFDADAGEDPFASHVGPLALAATEEGYVAVGRHNDRPLAWLSTDGQRWRAVDLPTPPGARSTGVDAVAAAPDGRLVAVGTSARRDAHYTILSWLSADGGRTWRRGTVPDPGGDPQLPVLVHDGRRFVALGGANGDVRGPALVLTSADGTSWQREETDARMLTSATVLPGGTVVAVSSTGETRDTDETGGTRECAAAWLRSPGGSWSREELGCDGVPTSLTPLHDGRVAAVHWTTLFVRRAPTPAGSPR